HFAPWSEGFGKEAAPGDQICVVGWRASADGRALLVAISKYESVDTNRPVLQRFELSGAKRGGASDSSLRTLGNSSSPGPLAVADIDGDGDLDLFIGGRIVPGRYPEAASSQLYKNKQGELELDEANSALVKNIGLVSGAVFSDLDGDGFPELILACEW